MKKPFQPTKPRVYASLEQMLERLYAEVGGAKRAAHLLGKSPSAVYGYADPQATTLNISFADVARLTDASGSVAAVDHLARMIGAVVLPPVPAEADTEWSDLGAEASKEFAEFMAVLFRDLSAESDEPGRVSRAEAPETLRELDDILGVLTRARVRLQQIISEG